MTCNRKCGTCEDWKCRCSDCFALVETDDVEYFCDEWQKPCKDVIDCKEWGE